MKIIGAPIEQNPIQDHNDRVAHSTSWDDPPDSRNCSHYWEFKGAKFPCDLKENHFGPHVNHPKERGHDAVIIWSSCNDEEE